MLLRGESYTILLGEKHVPAGDLGKAQFGDGSIYNGDNTASFARLVDIDHPLAQGPADTFKLNFGSWHAGVCQFVMADGSVRVISNDTDPEMVKMLIPRGLPKAN
jgi:prepilin-type processing-associated H-X9-DG protein